MAARGEFSSKLAFVLAASGSAIGLGNIWGFPIQVAENGGGAFVFVYLLLTFLLAYPVLMTELLIGRYAKQDTLSSMLAISGKKTRGLAFFTGCWGILAATLILSFYSIVAGWMLAYFVAAIVELIGLTEVANWMEKFSVERNVLFCAGFYLFTIKIVISGVTDGIEKWSTRLMPLLLILIVLLIVYIATLDGAAKGWAIYLKPDFTHILKPDLIISALGQAFFSLSLGVGTMMIYGSYISHKESLPKLGASVALMDVSIAFLAGCLVIPAMYVALNNQVQIFDDKGNLIESVGLIFTVIPSLFDALGGIGIALAILFFLLMTIASVTSSISMLEVPVACIKDRANISRRKASWLVGASAFVISLILIFNFDALFARTIAFSTEVSQPLIGLLFCVFLGWVWQRSKVLEEIKQGSENIENSLFWKIWPNYVKWVCPIMILVLFIYTV